MTTKNSENKTISSKDENLISLNKEIKVKTNRKCSICKEEGHDKRKCESTKNICKITKKDIFEYKFNISIVINNESIINDYIYEINSFIKNKTIYEVLIHVRKICFGLPSEQELIEMLKSDKNIKDKGLFGKIIEYGFFGQKPNNNSNCDIVKLNYDIKSCAFKELKNKGINAKERQTITNCGDTNNYDSFKNISDNILFSNTTYYTKSKKHILFVRKDDKIKEKTFEQILSQYLYHIIFFDMEKLPKKMLDVINDDYNIIRQCIIEKRVSQKGQKFLHIHPHGSGHGSGTRALGFTSKFITIVVALRIAEIYKKNIENVLIKSGRSLVINNKFLLF